MALSVAIAVSIATYRHIAPRSGLDARNHLASVVQVPLAPTTGDTAQCHLQLFQEGPDGQSLRLTPPLTR